MGGSYLDIEDFRWDFVEGNNEKENREVLTRFLLVAALVPVTLRGRDASGNQEQRKQPKSMAVEQRQPPAVAGRSYRWLQRPFWHGLARTGGGVAQWRQIC